MAQRATDGTCADKPRKKVRLVAQTASAALLDEGRSPEPSDVEAVLNSWNPYILRQAGRVVRASGGSGDDIDDLAQAARIAIRTGLIKGADASDLRLRRVIAAAIKDAARRERRGFRSGSVGRIEFCDTTHGFAATEPSDAVEAVREFTSTLPTRMRTLYWLLYGQGYTQSEVAALMHISQPRVSQLHRDMKCRARMALARFAA